MKKFLVLICSGVLMTGCGVTPSGAQTTPDQSVPHTNVQSQTTEKPSDTYTNNEYSFSIQVPSDVTNPPIALTMNEPFTNKPEIQYNFGGMLSISVVKSITPKELAHSISENTQFAPQPTSVTVHNIPALYLQIDKATGLSFHNYFFAKGDNTIVVSIFTKKDAKEVQTIVNSFTFLTQ